MGFIQVLSRGLFGFSFSEGAAYHTLGLGSSDHQDMRVIHGGWWRMMAPWISQEEKKNEIQRYNEIGTGKGESIVDI